MKNVCTQDIKKITGVVYIPTQEEFMCKSIRQYYAKIQFTEQGYSKEQAELITKTMVG